MTEPGLNLHEWQSEMASLEDDLHESPAETLPELDNLIRRMLEDSGFELNDQVVREGEEREVVSDYLAANEIRLAVERGSEGTSAGDVAAAVNAYLELFDYIVAMHADADPDFGP